MLLFLSLSLIRCGDQERGGYCFSGSCLQVDGGSYAFPEVCNPYQCYLPEEAPAAGVAACHQYVGPYTPCAAAPTGCTGRYAFRPDWEDCYHKY